ncbi:TonB-linked SusC/RagA family outer membrane protein [Pedobacter sp. AK017]|uniref:SusC/RagA family TonB-linked outer membrane protein n=1 Tax=Pedobacter sp. AK017 TaxID=2723073 RepID=UPI0016103FD0|nr:SusC/RagA family TonB-linked outer membrane protein [Pedobacter sp. AK017]MBB5436607.1 TonB-linked SusC/RagA family outer membrane protein [Pedobacter sp. AK017]
MRLTTVILFFTVFQISAATTFGQKVTYNKKNTTIKQVFTEIKNQTGYNVIWYDGKLNAQMVINANFNNTSLDDVMKSTLKGRGVTYEIRDKTVIVKVDESSFADKIISFFTTIDVRGRILDENDAPLVGAIVKVKGTKLVAPTNGNGEFVLNGVDEKAILTISFLGYETKEVAASKSIGIIKLTLNADKLEEVEINAGYYTVKDRERTGAISRVTAAQIADQPVNNPLMALQGRVAGLQIIQANGIAGSAFTVRVRGTNSIRSGNDPLYIVDGVIYPSSGISGIRTNTSSIGANGVSPLSLINPNDIQSIEVLKDGDATAIYGSRGANGVILITTKRGKSGRASINANLSQGINQVGHRLNLLNTEEYLEMRREAYFTNDKLTTSSPTYATQYDINGTYDQNKYTDWQKELIGKTASTTNAAVNITGGTDKSNYLMAGNYYREGTIYPGDFGFKRYGIRSSINLGATEDRFNVNLTLNLNRTNSNIAENIVPHILLAPNAPDLLDESGKINWANNTVALNPMAALLKTNNAITDNLVGNLTMNYSIIKNLVIKSSIGYSSIKRKELSTTPLASIAPIQNSTSTARESFFGNNYVNNFIFEPQIIYKAKVGAGNIDALVGMSLQNNDAQINVMRGSNFTSDDLLKNIGSAASLTTTQNDFSQYRYIAAFGRLNYNLANKYFLNLTARRDGSSKFGPGRQFANFGALGAGWIFSDEKLFKEKLSFLSFGKLRASYGVTGNDQIPNYGFLQLWSNGTVYDNTSTLVPNTVAPNDEFSWETNRKLEAALQLGFLKDRINLELSFYRNRSSNQLILQSLPLSAGLLSVQRNLPAEIQNKGWELESDFKIINNNVFKWSAALNISIPKNKLLSYPDLENSSNASVYTVGQPLEILKALNVILNTQTGLYTFEDKNGSGTLDNADIYISKFLGQYFYGGLENTLTYKKFSLNFHFTFAKQNGRRSIGASSPGTWAVGNFSNQSTEVLKRWQQAGDETSIQRFGTTSTTTNPYNTAMSFGNMSVVDASYMRLRNLSLSYSLPEKLLSSIKINAASITLQGQNLFTITNYMGLDPETPGSVVPPLRTLMLGLNVTF